MMTKRPPTWVPGVVLSLIALTASSALGGIVAPHFNFNGPPGGHTPSSRPVYAPDGFVYGTTSSGGAFNAGTFFRMDASGTMTKLHDFNPALEGGNPTDSTYLGSDGFFYVITRNGGPGAVCDILSRTSCGSLVRLDALGGLTVLHVFDQYRGPNGAYPLGGVVEGPDGALYGATENGTAEAAGLLYRIDPGTGEYSVLHEFDGVNGFRASGPLHLADDGRLWGTSDSAITNNGGLVFAIDERGNFEPIRFFDGAAGGGPTPVNGLVQGADGLFYGTTRYSTSSGGLGTVFRMDAQGGLTTLHVFQGGDDGRHPSAPLLLASDGFIYGQADPGYDDSSIVTKATVFRIAADGSYSWVGGLTAAQGIFPRGGLIEGPGGDLYGTASRGGAYSLGTFFRFVRGMHVRSVSVSPDYFVGGESATGTVTLTEAAPAGGVVVSLASAPAAVRVPPTLSVAAGATTASFVVTTSAVGVDTWGTVTATLGGSARSAGLRVAPVPTITAFTQSPSTVTCSYPTFGRITLSGPAPRPGGAVVKLVSSNARRIPVPPSVTVPAGATEVIFTLTPPCGSGTQSTTITASYNGASRSAALTVLPIPVLTGITLNPTVVKGGLPSTGRVVLSAPAPPAGEWVNLASSNTNAATVPSSVLVPAGSNAVSFSVVTLPQPRKRSVTISAIHRRVTKKTSLTVNP